MTLTFVAHNTPEPALYGAMAAVLAEQRDAELAHLAVEWDRQSYADACQHVTPEGHLVTSGLLWHERLGAMSAGKVWQLDDLLSLHGGKDYIVPLAPVQLASFTRLAREARNYSVDYQLIEIEHTARGFQFSRMENTENRPVAWTRDRFGRVIPNTGSGGQPGSGHLRIALIGTYQDQIASYPATLAALGDAIDALELEVEIICLPPCISPRELSGVLKDIDGVLLPGGSDMRNVAGQIRVAHHCLNHEIPTLGLCLGMQTMATAAIQQMLGSAQANLAEVDPHAQLKTFIPLNDTPQHPVHRLGDDDMKLVSGTQMAAVMGDKTRLRYNHRFQLNPLFKDELAANGLLISGTDNSGTIADAIEHTSHPFFLGVQGHPELTSTPQWPSPLIGAFLLAAKGKA